MPLHILNIMSKFLKYLNVLTKNNKVNICLSVLNNINKVFEFLIVKD